MSVHECPATCDGAECERPAGHTGDHAGTIVRAVPGLLTAPSPQSVVVLWRNETPGDAARSCPECLAGKHGNCDGSSWDDATDARGGCPCAGTRHVVYG